MKSGTPIVNTSIPTTALVRNEVGWARQVYARMLGGWVCDLLVFRQREHLQRTQGHGSVLKKAA